MEGKQLGRGREADRSKAESRNIILEIVKHLLVGIDNTS